jgi:glycosyltransferase involved in cell wall biosynthesis
MRLAYVCADPGVPVYGSKGASVHVQEVVRALRQQGASVTLFAARVGGEAPADLADVRLVALPKLPKGDVAQRERDALAANADLRARLLHEGPFDAVYERYSLWSYAGMETARQLGAPGLLEVNAPLIEEQRQHRDLVHPDEAQAVAQRAFGAATALLPVSSGVADYLKSFPGIARKLHVTPNGVDPTRFLPHRPDPETFTVGFVGTLKPWHGVCTLLEAFATLERRLPSARLLIVGSGPEQARLEAEATRLGLADAVSFTGAVAPARVPELLARMDVATAPYPALEGFYFSPLKVYEYMAASVPVVASGIGQLESLIEDGVNGLLCAPGSAVHLSAALTILAENPPLRRSLSEAGRDTILRSHTWHKVAERILMLTKLSVAR